jgi:hypothetical protein
MNQTKKMKKVACGRCLEDSRSDRDGSDPLFQATVHLTALACQQAGRIFSRADKLTPRLPWYIPHRNQSSSPLWSVMGALQN